MMEALIGSHHFSIYQTALPGSHARSLPHSTRLLDRCPGVELVLAIVCLAAGKPCSLASMDRGR
jgi:hypothetical protein